MRFFLLTFAFLAFQATASLAAPEEDISAALAHYESKDYRRAIETLSTVLDAPVRDDLAAVAYKYRAKSYLRTAQYENAIADYSKRISLLNKPNSHDFADRARALEKVGRLDEALKDFNKAVELDPNRPFAYGIRAAFYEKQGKLSLALHDISKVIALDSDYSLYHNYFTRARLYEKLGDLPSAYKDFDQILKNEKNEERLAQAFSKYVAMATRHRDPRKVLEISNDAINQERMEFLAFPARATAHLQLQKFDRAVSDADRAIGILREKISSTQGILKDKLSDLRQKMIVVRGSAFVGKGDFINAIPILTEALDINPRDAHALAMRGIAYAVTNDRERAITDLEKALELDPGNAGARKMLEQLDPSRKTVSH